MKYGKYYWYLRIESIKGELMEFVYPCNSDGSSSVTLSQLMPRSDIEKYYPELDDEESIFETDTYFEEIVMRKLLDNSKLKAEVTSVGFRAALTSPYNIFPTYHNVFNIEEIYGAKTILLCPIDVEKMEFINAALEKKGIKPITFFGKE